MRTRGILKTSNHSTTRNFCLFVCLFKGYGNFTRLPPPHVVHNFGDCGEVFFHFYEHKLNHLTFWRGFVHPFCTRRRFISCFWLEMVEGLLKHDISWLLDPDNFWLRDPQKSVPNLLAEHHHWELVRKRCCRKQMLDAQDTVDGWNSANRLRLVVGSLFSQVLHIPGGKPRISEPLTVGSGFSMFHSMESYECWKHTSP